jgi:hypothetical protein
MDDERPVISTLERVVVVELVESAVVSGLLVTVTVATETTVFG